MDQPSTQLDPPGSTSYNQVSSMVSAGEEETTLVPRRHRRRRRRDEDNGMDVSSSSNRLAKWTLLNFVGMSVLFSANHGCTVACLSLATARLHRVGAWQSGVLYLTYTASAVLGATYVVKKLGARNSLALGMGLYCAYVACFWVATIWTSSSSAVEIPAALLGAAIGGIGGGFLWTAQGSYFAKASQQYSLYSNQDTAKSTSRFAGIFAFIYLTEEVLLRSLSTGLLSLGIMWHVIFAIYTLVALMSTFGMVLIHNYPKDEHARGESVWRKVTAAWWLLKEDPKMKYTIGWNAVFGFSGAFLNSYVNGEVVRVALRDDNSRYVGVLSALVAAVAAVGSLGFSRIPRKGPVLILGAVAFLFVAVPFIVLPRVSNWGWPLLVFVYTMQGVGRATFEGTLKATFADYFPRETEGAFANIILQNGLSSSIGFFLSFGLTCDNTNTSTSSPYCVQYSDGSWHNVLLFELLVVITAIVAILGYWRASILFQREQQNDGVEETELLENQAAVSA